MTASHVSSPSRTRVKLNVSVFFLTLIIKLTVTVGRGDAPAVHLLKLMPEVKCNSYIIKFSKFTRLATTIQIQYSLDDDDSRLAGKEAFSLLPTLSRYLI